MTEPHDPAIRVQQTHYPDGTLKEEIHYKGTREHGSWRRWHPNAQLAEEYWFEDGVYANSTAKTWHPNGAIASEVVFVRGTVVSTRVYSDTGKLIARTNSVDRGKVIKKMIARAMATKVQEITLEQGTADQVDAFARNRLSAGVTAEAMQWLREASSSATRTLGELDASTSMELVTGLYDLGAAAVFAVEIEQSLADASQTTNHVIVQLPTASDNTAARARLFALKRSIGREQGFDPEPDCGQAYVYLKLC